VKEKNSKKVGGDSNDGEGAKVKGSVQKARAQKSQGRAIGGKRDGRKLRLQV